jgi:hypothetical protein
VHTSEPTASPDFLLRALPRLEERAALSSASVGLGSGSGGSTVAALAMSPQSKHDLARVAAATVHTHNTQGSTLPLESLSLN